MNYVIAIPSYKRPETLRKKTLALLSRHGIPLSKITVFVADENERAAYEALCPGLPLVVAEPGLNRARNFISRYYPEGTRIMSFDDDVSDIMRKSGNSLVPVGNLEKELIGRGFAELEKHQAHLFGVYAASNAMFMKHRVAVGLYYCIGSCWGVINRHDQDLAIQNRCKEDVERCLRFYTKDGRVVRLDDLTVKTNYYTEPGGLQEYRTMEVARACAIRLAEEFPDLISLYVRKSTGYTEVRLKDRSGVRPGSRRALTSLQA